jgi:excisionase family DNA binding protein
MSQKLRYCDHRCTVCQAKGVRKALKHVEGMMNTFRHTDLLTPEELAEMLKVPVSWVYEHCRERTVNRLPGFKIGKYIRFRESDVFEWLGQQSR